MLLGPWGVGAAGVAASAVAEDAEVRVATLRFASDEACDGGLSGGSTGATGTDPERARFLGTIHAYRVVEYVERW